MNLKRDWSGISVKPGSIAHVQLLEDVMSALHEAMSRAAEAGHLLQKIEDHAEADRVAATMRDLAFIYEGVRREHYWVNHHLLNPLSGRSLMDLRPKEDN